MKFLQAQGHFGVLDGQKIRFEDGLNVLYLPNEGGKTTLCNFLRVMLYGLNTSRRDGKNQLSDKTNGRDAASSSAARPEKERLLCRSFPHIMPIPVKNALS